MRLANETKGHLKLHDGFKNITSNLIFKTIVDYNVDISLEKCEVRGTQYYCCSLYEKTWLQVLRVLILDTQVILYMKYLKIYEEIESIHTNITCDILRN